MESITTSAKSSSYGPPSIGKFLKDKDPKDRGKIVNLYFQITGALGLYSEPKDIKRMEKIEEKREIVWNTFVNGLRNYRNFEDFKSNLYLDFMNQKQHPEIYQIIKRMRLL